MNYTNINIVDNTGSRRVYKYIVELTPSNGVLSMDYTNRDGIYFKHPTYQTLIREFDTWVSINEASRPNISSEKCVITSLYIPQYSAETYNQNINYVFDISLFIRSKEIHLASVLVNYKDAVATTTEKVFLNRQYYNVINIPIFDPNEIIYGESWRLFRESIKANDGEFELNDDISNLKVSINLVDEYNGTYLPKTGFDSGQSAILLGEPKHIQFNLSKNTDKFLDGDVPGINCEFLYNEVYDATPEGFAEYLKETYLMENPNITLEVTLKDKDSIYKYLEFDIGVESNLFIPYSEFGLSGWSEYINGLEIIACATISNEEPIFEIYSNSIPVDQDVFKYMIKTGIDFDSINLDFINMNNYNLDIVNKVQKNIISIDHRQESNSGIIKPIFFQAGLIDNLTIYPGVISNVSVNLDDYKSKVGAFYIRLGDVNFPEIARNNTGVIFKINGNKLPNLAQSGSYYILNEDLELVTIGKYKTV